MRTKYNVKHDDGNIGKNNIGNIPMYVTRDEKNLSEMVTSISNIVANHAEREMESKRKKRKQKRSYICKDNANSQFESIRGDKFHKEWRSQK